MTKKIMDNIASKMNELEFQFGGTLDYNNKDGPIYASLPLYSEVTALDVANIALTELGYIDKVTIRSNDCEVIITAQ